MSAPDASPELKPFDTLLASYLDLIRDVAEAVELIRPEISSNCYHHLVRARSRLAENSTIEALQETSQELHEELKLFSEKARQFGDTQSFRNNVHAEWLTTAAEHLDLTIQSGDLKRLHGQAAELRDFAHRMLEENRDAMARLQQAELLAYLDPLTSVPNRREFDRQLAIRMAATQDFCVLLFDLDRFKAVNDQFGHLCGDEILRQLGARLTRQVRARDFVCRWGGDEFVIILDCALPVATSRATAISKWLSGAYRLTVHGQEQRIEISVSFGVVQRAPGETPEQLFHRVDDSLYIRKKDRHDPAAPRL